MSDLEFIAEGLRGLAVPIGEVHEDGANARTGHALERAAAAMTAKRVLSDAHINALVDGYPAYDATIEAEQ